MMLPISSSACKRSMALLEIFALLLALANSEDCKAGAEGMSLLQTKRNVASATAKMWNMIWQGEDLSDDEHALALHDFRSSGASLAFSQIGNITAPAVRVAGFFGSGTNLMQAFLQENFGDDVYHGAGLCDCSVAERARTQPSCDEDFWKHTHPMRLASFDTEPDTPRPMVLVIMIRNPISQIASWAKQSFNLWPCTSSLVSGSCACEEACDGLHCSVESPNYFPCNPPASSDVKELLQLNFGTVPGSEFDQSHGSYQDGAIGAWNSYVAGYQALLSASLALPMHIIRYEDLVLDPEAVLKSLAEALNTEAPGKVHIMDSNQRTFIAGDTPDRQEAMNNIESKAYRQELSSEDLQSICSHIDLNLLAEFGYGDEC